MDLQYWEMLLRLAAVEEAVSALSVIRAGIGHNHPPEPIDDPIPFGENDQQAIVAAISNIRAQPAAPQTPPVAGQEAVSVFKRRAAEAKEYALKQGDTFVTEIVKESAKTTITAVIGTGTVVGVGVTLGYVFYVLAERLLSAADAIQAWLDLLGSLQ